MRDTNFFRDPRFIGGGWKAMPADRSTLRPAERHEQLWPAQEPLAETDMFAFDHTSELYAHTNANCVRIGELPLSVTPAHAGVSEQGGLFFSMGQVLLPEVEIAKPEVEIAKALPSAIKARVRTQWTFPLAFGEIGWGDGKESFIRTFDLSETRAFGNATFAWTADGKTWQGGSQRSVGRRWQRRLHQPSPPLANEGRPRGNQGLESQFRYGPVGNARASV